MISHLEWMGILPNYYWDIEEQISIPFATVYNLLLEGGDVPLELKEAAIIPVFKKGSRNNSET